MPDDLTPDPSAEDLPLPDATDRAVRRLLAEARVTDPVPEEVAARLDAALETLRPADESPTHEPVAPVIALDSRRRRVLPGLLAAAAAVVAVGVVAPQVLPRMGSSDENSSASTAYDAAADQERDAPAPEAGAEDQSQRSKETAPLSSAMTDAMPLVRVRPRHLQADLETLRDLATTTAAAATPTTCPAVGDATDALLTSYAGDPAYVVLAPPTEDGQQAEVFSCADGASLASATLPAP